MGKHEAWERVEKSVVRQVRLANERRPGKFKIAQTQPFISVVSSHGHTAVIDLDSRQRVISVTIPPISQCAGRNGQFAVSGDQTIVKKEFVGAPEPPASPMSPEEFCAVVLAPFFEAA